MILDFTPAELVDLRLLRQELQAKSRKYSRGKFGSMEQVPDDNARNAERCFELVDKILKAVERAERKA